MIDLPTQHLNTILGIFRRHLPGCTLRVFGSRVTGKARRFSDLDLAIIGDGPIDPHLLEAVRDELSESDLPIMVDIVDWQRVSADFRTLVERSSEVLHP